MAQTELEELRTYWSNKYPNVEVWFYPPLEDGKFRGRMRNAEGFFDLQADTIGELINQGEAFLRKTKS